MGMVATLPIPAGSTVRLEGGAGLCRGLGVSRTQIAVEILLAALSANLNESSSREHRHWRRYDVCCEV